MKTATDIKPLEAEDINSQPGRGKLVICRSASRHDVRRDKGESDVILNYTSFQDEPELATVGARLKTITLAEGQSFLPWVVVRVERAKCEPGSVFSDIYLLWCKRIEPDEQ